MSGDVTTLRVAVQLGGGVVLGEVLGRVLRYLYWVLSLVLLSWSH